MFIEVDKMMDIAPVQDSNTAVSAGDFEDDGMVPLCYEDSGEETSNTNGIDDRIGDEDTDADITLEKHCTITENKKPESNEGNENNGSPEESAGAKVSIGFATCDSLKTNIRLDENVNTDESVEVSDEKINENGIEDNEKNTGTASQVVCEDKTLNPDDIKKKKQPTSNGTTSTFNEGLSMAEEGNEKTVTDDAHKIVSEPDCAKNPPSDPAHDEVSRSSSEASDNLKEGADLEHFGNEQTFNNDVYVDEDEDDLLEEIKEGEEESEEKDDEPPTKKFRSSTDIENRELTEEQTISLGPEQISGKPTEENNDDQFDVQITNVNDDVAKINSTNSKDKTDDCKSESVLGKKNLKNKDEKLSENHDVTLEGTSQTIANNPKESSNSVDQAKQPINKVENLDDSSKCQEECKPNSIILDPQPKKIVDMKKIQLNFLRKFKRSFDTMNRADLEQLVLQKVAEAFIEKSNLSEMNSKIDAQEKIIQGYRNKVCDLSKQYRDLNMLHERLKKDLEAHNNKFVAPIKITRAVGLQVWLPQKPVPPQQRIPISTAPCIAFTTNAQTQSKSPSPAKTADQSTSNAMFRTSITSQTTAKTVSVGTSETSHGKTQPLNAPLQKVLPQNAPTARVPSQTIVKPTNILPPSVSVAIKPKPVAPFESSKPSTDRPPLQMTPPLATALANTSRKSNVKFTTGSIKDIHKKPPTQAVSPLVQEKTVQSLTHVYNAQQQRVAPIILKKGTNGCLTASQSPNGSPNPTSSESASVHKKTESSSFNTMTKRLDETRSVIVDLTDEEDKPAVPPLALISSHQRSQNNIINQNGGSHKNNMTRTKLANQVPCKWPKYTHPAPLIDAINSPNIRHELAPPPIPNIRIINNSKAGIVISWLIAEENRFTPHARIQTYQVYAYHEPRNRPPHIDIWSHVGDVKAMVLPMAVTLTQFAEGQRYYFAVRGVDEYGRSGKFSAPGTWT